MSEFRAEPGAGLAGISSRQLRRQYAPERARAGDRRKGTLPPLPVELAAFEGILDRTLLETAARRAEALGVGGDEVLRNHGIVSADQLTEAVARKLGLAVDPLTDHAALPPERLLEVAANGVLMRRMPGGETLITVAPRGLGIRRLAKALAGDRELKRHVRMASPERLSNHVRKIGTRELAHEAVFGLYGREPDLSAANRTAHPLRWFSACVLLLLIVGGVLMPAELLLVVEYFLGISFLAWIGLRLFACWVKPLPRASHDLPARELPVYTVIVPLYREANMVPQLVGALKRLRYPPEKLDIKLVLESDDTDTRLAVAAQKLTAPFEVILSPAAGPRTKPKALAAALHFARGEFVVVYDAEDVPDPDQLRVALSAFFRGPRSLACVQAMLAVNNSKDGWLARHFAAEYAGLFDVFLPALAYLHLPLPLGGTSNHFRISALKEVGGWDPFNVTEDADLGMRLARFGFHTGVISSTTWEEAPVRFGQWLRQRTRWFKGWMQTWIVHMRSPFLLKKEMGLRGFLSLQLFVGGTVLAALVHPLFMLFVVNDFVLGGFFVESESFDASFRKYFSLAILVSGYLGSGALAFAGLWRRGMKGGAWVLLTIPVYWMLLSLAAWRAVYQLIVAPYYWEKTEHGVAGFRR